MLLFTTRQYKKNIQKINRKTRGKRNKFCVSVPNIQSNINMKTINLGIQIVPKSKTQEAYDLVDKAIEIIQQSGVSYEVTPFETVMEGPEAQLMAIAKKAQEAVLAAGADEILVYYRIQIRKEGDVTMVEKTGKFKH